MSATAGRMPTIFLAHGAPPLLDDARWMKELADWAQALPRPRAVLMLSAHWEERPLTLGATRPVPLVYDFYGFPQRFYEMQYPAPGAPWLAERIGRVVGEHQPVAEDRERGLDHGAYVPLMGMYPKADVPVLQASLPTLEPKALFALGRALAPLRDEGVLIVGSGMSYHNMRGLMGGADPARDSLAFDSWLGDACTAEPVARTRLLAQWERAPAARASHPREEHLLPLMVSAGAGGGDPGRRVFQDRVLGATVSAFAFGA